MTKNELIELVDNLGIIAAQQSALEARAKAIKAKLIASGRPAIDGKFYRATVSKYEQTRLNMEAVRAKLTPQFIAKNSETSEVTKVLVKALSPDLVEAK